VFNSPGPSSSDPAFAAHNALSSNHRLRSNPSHPHSRTEIFRFTCWCTGLRTLLLCSLPLAASGCGVVVSGNVAKGAGSNTTVPTLNINAPSVAFGNVEVNTSA
jgi:hypothetical protein